MKNNPNKRLYTIPEVKEATTLGTTSIYNAINAGLLELKKFGSKSLITAESLEAFIDSLPSKGNVGGGHD